MANYDIGISGLNAAQRSLDIIGNNVANAATEGYHRQKVELAPAYAVQYGATMLGGGVDVEGVTRFIDDLLEKEITKQSSMLGKTDQEYNTLRTIESAFGEFSTDKGLNKAIGDFFNSFSNLSLHPSEGIWQRQVVTSAQTVAGQFRSLGEFIGKIENQIALECGNVTNKVNSLIDKIGSLNDTIERLAIGGANANNLRDERDRSILELSKLVNVDTQSRNYGVVDVVVNDIPVVIGATVTHVETGYTEDGKLGLGIEGSFNYSAEIEGGKLGGLISLNNDLVADIRDRIDTLAQQLIRQVNAIHVQGVGTSGSFTDINGWRMTDTDVADFEPQVTDGSVFIRITNTSTGEITRQEVIIDKDTDTLATAAAKIDALTGISASVIDSRLHIAADANYKFDFMPAVLSEPTASALTGTLPPSVNVGGIYSGTGNKTIYFTVQGSGDVGNGTLNLIAEEDDGLGGRNTLASFNIGSGYAAGDVLDTGYGVKIKLGVGDVNDGDTFDVDVYSDTDTADFLSAVGVNVFFNGKDADSIEVYSDIVNNPTKIATSIGPEMNDNGNALLLAALKDTKMDDLEGLSLQEYYHELVAGIGQDVSLKKTDRDTIEVLTNELGKQQSDISGVDINSEAADMLVFQQMFQAMSKYIVTVKDSIDSLMQLVR